MALAPKADHFRNGSKSVVLCNRRLPDSFRYALLATVIARRRNMSQRAKRQRNASGSARIE